MSNLSPAIAAALAPLRAILSADGYELDVRAENGQVLIAEIKAGPTACAECLVPKEIMRTYFDSALRASLGINSPEVRLVYPADICKRGSTARI
jgi:hypothetical protein